MDICISTKSLWDRLKKLYGNEPCTVEPVCGNKKMNEAYVFVDDEGKSVSSSRNYEEETHLFMAQELEDERHTSESNHIDHSYRQDVFGSDDQDEVTVDLECELVSTLEELQNVRKEFKRYKDLVHEECSRLRICLEESNNNICILTSQLEEAKGLTGELQSIFDAKERTCEDLQLKVEKKDEECQDLKGEMESIRKDLEKYQNKLKVRIWYDGSIEALDKMLSK